MRPNVITEWVCCEFVVARQSHICVLLQDVYCYVLCEWQINICMVGNLRKEERAAVSALCLGRREIRGAVIGCVERSLTDKSQQRKCCTTACKQGARDGRLSGVLRLEFCVCSAQGSPVLLTVPFQSISRRSLSDIFNNAGKYCTSKSESVLFVCSFSTYLKVMLHSKI